MEGESSTVNINANNNSINVNTNNSPPFTVYQPPKCSREFFQQWKVRMKTFLKCHDYLMYWCLFEEPDIPMMVDEKGSSRPKTQAEMTVDERNLAKASIKAMGYLYESLDFDMFVDVQNCSTAKEIWDALNLLYEGNEEQKRNKIRMLMREFEMFKHKPEEPLESIYKRYTRLLLELKSYGEVLRNEVINDKFMRSLPMKFYVKMVMIEHDQMWTKRPLSDIYGSLKVFEVYHLKGTGAGVAQNRDSSDGEQEDDEKTDSDIDHLMAFITRKYKKFLKKDKAKRFGHRTKETDKDVKAKNEGKKPVFAATQYNSGSEEVEESSDDG